jgi:predicted GTPase
MGAGLFVAGTDTDVGKTAVAVAIVRQLVRAGLRVVVDLRDERGALPQRSVRRGEQARGAVLPRVRAAARHACRCRG